MDITINLNEVEHWVKENIFLAANAHMKYGCCDKVDRSVTMGMIEAMSDEELLNLAAKMGYFNKGVIIYYDAENEMFPRR